MNRVADVCSSSIAVSSVETIGSVATNFIAEKSRKTVVNLMALFAGVNCFTCG